MHVSDANDNSPEFVFPSYGSRLPHAYLGFVAEGTRKGSSVASVVARDADEGPFGDVAYEIVPETNRGGYFTIDSTSGRISADRDLASVPRALLPFNLTVVAADNPQAQGTDRRTAQAPVIVSEGFMMSRYPAITLN